MENQEPTAPRPVSRALGNVLAAAARDPAAEVLLQLVDLSLAGVVFFAPLIMAGRHPWGRLVLVALVATSAVCWAFYQARRRRANYARTGVEWLLLAGAVLLAVQLLPLPAAWLQALSPKLPETLPLWFEANGPAAALGTWSQVSLHPEATRGALVMYASYALLFLVVVQRIETRDDAERLVRWLAIAAVGMALLGLFQFLTTRAPFLRVGPRAAASERPLLQGTFGDQDSFAHFLALGIGPLIWWTQRQFVSPHGRRRRSLPGEWELAGQTPEHVTRLLLGGALAAVGLAALLTFSRSGILAMLASACVSSTVCWFHGISRNRIGWGLLAAVCLLGAVFWGWAYEPLMGELRNLGGQSPPDLTSADAPSPFWLAGLRAASDFPLLGTGAGTSPDVLPAYLHEAGAGQPTRTGNGYLQVFQETGLAGFLLLLIGLGHVGRYGVRLVRKARDRRAAALAACVAATVAAGFFQTLVHAPWSVPACLSVTIIAVACGYRLFQLQRREPRRGLVSWPRSAWIGAVFVLLLVSLGMLRDRLPPAVAAADWDRYVTLDMATEPAREIGSLPAGGHFLSSSVASAEDSDILQRHLTRVLLANPHDADAHLQLAQCYLRSFERQRRASGRAPSLTQLRETAASVIGSSRAEREQWLHDELGPLRPLLARSLDHTRQALRQCPLSGQGYLILAELSFLESEPSANRYAYLDQAIRVRPHNATILLAAGREAAQAGDLERAAHPWTALSRQGNDARILLLDALAERLPATYLLRQLSLDTADLRRLYAHYRNTGRSGEAREVARPLAEALRRDVRTKSGTDTAGTWYELHALYRVLQDPEQALHAVEQAVQTDPDNDALRRALADRLLERGDYAEAAAQLQWCLERTPEDEDLRQQLTRLSRLTAGTRVH